MSEFKVGSKARVIGNTCYHDMKIGDIVTLKRIYYSPLFDLSDINTPWSIEENDDCYIRENDLQLVETQPQPQIKIVMVGKSVHGEYIDGDIKRVAGIGPTDFETGAAFVFKQLMEKKETPKAEKAEKAISGIDYEGFIKGKFGINCKTKEDALAFLTEFEHRYPSLRWNNGDKFTECYASEWDTYREKTVLNMVGKSTLGYCTTDGYFRKEHNDFPVVVYRKEGKKLYCVISYQPGEFLTAGKVYDISNGYITYDDGYRIHWDGKNYFERCGEKHLVLGYYCVLLGECNSYESKPLQNSPEKSTAYAKLLCVKEDPNWLIKGKTYEFVDGDIRLESGTYWRGEYPDYENFCKLNPKLSSCLVPLVERKAEVGEWIYINDASHYVHNEYKNGDILKVKTVANDAIGFGSCGVFSTVCHREYLVLDGYKR